MGWLREDDHPAAYEHEGFVVAIVREDGQFRELGYSHDERDRDFTGEVTHMAAACECGWRSQRFLAPLEAGWMPFSICLPEECEDALIAVWATEHRDHLDRPMATFHAERSASWRRGFERAWRERAESANV